MGKKVVIDSLIHGESLYLYRENRLSDCYFLRLLIDKENPKKQVYTLLLSKAMNVFEYQSTKLNEYLVNIYYMITVFPDKNDAHFVVHSSGDGRRSFSLKNPKTYKSDFCAGLFKNKGLSSYCLSLLIEITSHDHANAKPAPLYISGTYAIDQHDRRDHLYREKLKYTYPDNYDHLADGYTIYNDNTLKELCFYNEQFDKFKFLTEATLINIIEKHLLNAQQEKIRFESRTVERNRSFRSKFYDEMTLSSGWKNCYNGITAIFSELLIFLSVLFASSASILLGIIAVIYVPVSKCFNKIKLFGKE